MSILFFCRDGQFAPVGERCDDPLLSTLEDPKTIELLLSVIFARPQEKEEESKKEDEGKSSCGYCESSLVNGISVLMALLESRSQAPSQILITTTTICRFKNWALLCETFCNYRLFLTRRQPLFVGGCVSSASAGFSAATMYGGGMAAGAVDPNGGAEGCSTPEEAEKQQRLLDATIAAILPK